MQWHYGQTTPLRYAPFGTYPPKSVPFPGGNINYPTPHIAMGLAGIDAYHLSPDGYTVLSEFYVRKFISNYLRRERDTTLHSLGQNYDGWSADNQIAGTGNILVGKNNAQANAKGIFTFNTSSIPANKKVKKAVLFIKAKTIKRPYPTSVTFPQNFVLEIKNGSFGNDVIESSDYASIASMTDIACFAGNIRGNDYTLRAELSEDALQYINKNGITQFRLSITDDNLITFYNGDTTGFESPYLDLYYDTTSITTSIDNNKNGFNNLQIFPNPAKDEISIQIDKSWLNKKLNILIYNTNGVLVKSTPLDRITNEEIKIDIHTFPAGGYFINIEDNETKLVGTFVKLAE